MTPTKEDLSGPQALEELNDKLFSEYEGKLGTEAAAHCHETCRQYLNAILALRAGTRTVKVMRLQGGKPVLPSKQAV